jgi:hypothetical protein
MSLTYCHRCAGIMASALPLCPHCGAPRAERSGTAGGRPARTTWLAVGVGAVLGMAGGWAVARGAEETISGLLAGVLGGLVWSAVRHRW